MASLLSEKDSTPKYLETARRHMRTCSKTPGATPYAQRIEPIYNKLVIVQVKREEAQIEIQNGYDDIDLADTLLDDTVRDLYDLTTIADRRNAGLPLLPKIFPNGTFGYIVDSPLTVEIDEVKKIIDRLKEFDTEGKLSEFIEKLTAGITAVEQAIDTLKSKMENYKSIKSEMEIIKSDLRWQYEVNYLDARKQMGRKRAESLFPRTRKYSKPSADDGSEE